jgi:cobalt-zinc-cadmium efflux system outer membrane protein
MSLPLFDYNQGNVRRAEADVRSARAELARKELELTSKLASAYERYANARNQVEVYRASILPNAQQALKLVSDGYRQGELNYLLLLTSQRSYFANNLAYLEAVREMWESSIRIDGLLLDDGLQSASGETESTSTRNPPLPVLPFNGQ